jgi:hypothetical protein
MAILQIEAGWCGFGYAGGMVREARLGLVRVCLYDSSIDAELSEIRQTLIAADLALRDSAAGRRSLKAQITDQQMTIHRLEHDVWLLRTAQPARGPRGRFVSVRQAAQ